MKFDTTDLSISNGLKEHGVTDLHRDYIAHCFRWSFAAHRVRRKINGRKRRVLDFGCGKHAPFIDTLWHSRSALYMENYIGVDLNVINPRQARLKFFENREEINLWGETNILDVTSDMTGRIDMVTSFEVLEHCPPETMVPILTHLKDLATDDAEFIYSTPCYSPTRGAAKNHINEMTHEMFGWLLEECGYAIVENYGTFGNRSEYVPHMTEEHKKIFDELSKYHHMSVIANFIAPLYPQYARNNVWVLRKRDLADERKFPTKGPTPYAQHDYWAESDN